MNPTAFPTEFPSAFIITVAVILGALVGSFTNVLIYRIPRGESIAFPPSHCPNCNHQLHPMDLFPVFSWLLLGGKCRYCRAPISAQYPIIETISAIGYGLLAYFFPIQDVGASLLGLFFFFTVLLAISVIDLQTYTIPDSLSLVGLLVGLGFAWVNEKQGGYFFHLPGVKDAFTAALYGAGILALVGNLGSYLLRRFREAKYPSFPIDYQTLNLGALVGMWLGPWWAAGAVLLAMLINFAMRRYLRIPDFITFPGILISLVVKVNMGLDANLITTMLTTLQGLMAGAGIASLIAGFYWWLAPEVEEDIAEEDLDPIAMGFGDVKLMAMIGAFVGVSNVFVSLALAIFLGAILGILIYAVSKNRRIKFGPFLALGGFVALLYGPQITDWYTGMLLGGM
ncbi:prepilin peptidase [Deinococcus cellulosilyticus]|uniref:Prepilin peptidase n=1 Tax=Deinococcus cellulosilyticus (strain DSM 18568 / NBRC 106333 / KACC 11606 / 5516J-15) TaxID=1223518 RepID=A0A511MZT4_DEIC1|nr:prepilin peptidase [Deinococcus cellulosilyticus]GEM45748.1 prepilin peptidase [Deinococcus cellulosilyticus NBRC 106333 = KACC 11606]